MLKGSNRFALALAIGCAMARPAYGHFKLTKPTSWLKEDPSAVAGGGPQKGSPCGPGGYDDVKPVPTSGVVTDFHVGEMITVEWIDTVAHPGYFRIALAQNRADLKDPDIAQDGACSFDESKVPQGAHGNVLADGLFFRSRNGFTAAAGKTFSQQVTLPSTPCDKCTLQVVQVMEADIQSLSNCHYFHCADIRILAAGVSGGDGGASGMGGANASGGVAAGPGAGGSFGGGLAGAPAQGGTSQTTSAAGGTIASNSGGATDVRSTGSGGAPGSAGMVAVGPSAGAVNGGGGAAIALPPASSSSSSGSCTMARPERRASGALAAAWLIGIAAAIKRRNRRIL